MDEQFGTGVDGFHEFRGFDIVLIVRRRRVTVVVEQSVYIHAFLMEERSQTGHCCCSPRRRFARAYE